MGLLKIVYASSWTLWCNVHHPEIFSISIVNGCFNMPCTALFIYLFILVYLFIYLFIYCFIYSFLPEKHYHWAKNLVFSGPLRP